MAPAPSLPEVIHLIETESDDPTALGRLRAASDVAGRLAGVGDAALGYFVDQARHAGHSWSEIGTALGVTKQAAQQKHTVRPAPAVDVFERATPRARNAVGDAAPIARGRGHDQIGTEHLLLALYRDPDSIAAQILAESGLSEDAAAAAVEERAGCGGGAPDGELPFSPQARTVFSAALAAATDLGHNYIGTEHLLLGLARTDGLAREILSGAGLTPEALSRSVTEKLARHQ